MTPNPPVRRSRRAALRACVAGLALTFVAACGGEPVHLQAIVIGGGVGGSATLRIGTTAPFYAAAAMSDGSQEWPLDAAWASSRPAVAPVDAGGTVYAATEGTTVISATWQGVTGYRVVTVVP